MSFGNTWDDGSPHHCCIEKVIQKYLYLSLLSLSLVFKKVGGDCSAYEDVMLHNEQVNMFLNGQNGIRNKMAKDFGISNINTLVKKNPILNSK